MLQAIVDAACSNPYDVVTAIASGLASSLQLRILNGECNASHSRLTASWAEAHNSRAEHNRVLCHHARCCNLQQLHHTLARAELWLTLGWRCPLLPCVRQDLLQLIHALRTGLHQLLCCLPAVLKVAETRVSNVQGDVGTLNEFMWLKQELMPARSMQPVQALRHPFVGNMQCTQVPFL